MARKKLTDKLVRKDDIKEEIRKIEKSPTDYISENGNVYSEYAPNMFLKKKTRINEANGYVYCGIHYEGKNMTKRVHILVAKAFIPNTEGLKIVGHKNNIKHQNNKDNLYWTTVQENTQKAYDDGLAKNAKSFEDSQSIAVDVYTPSGTFIETIGSMSEAGRKYNIRKQNISNQCKQKTKKTSKKYIFRYHNEPF